MYQIELKSNTIQGRGRNGYFDIRRINVAGLKKEKTFNNKSFARIEVESKRTGRTPPIILQGEAKAVVKLLKTLCREIKKDI